MTNSLRLTPAQSLTQTLLQKKTPEETALFLKPWLDSLGFETQILTFQNVTNVYATKNLSPSTQRPSQKVLGFLGHSDVVPAGEGWSADPFSGALQDGFLLGRGAVDMKGGLACFFAALAENKAVLDNFPLALFISGDEEGTAEGGIPAVLQELEKTSSRPTFDFILIGEPTSRLTLGDYVKMGCRGSLNIRFCLTGTSGHVAALGQKIENVATIMIHFLHELASFAWPPEDEIFGPTNLEITTLDADSHATNVIPAQARGGFNIRFGTKTSAEQILAKIESVAASYPHVSWFIEKDVACRPFVSQPSPFLDVLLSSVEKVTGVRPKISAQGGNSDAKFIQHLCPFAECGLKVAEAHKANEKVSLEDLTQLTKIYSQFLKDWSSVRYFRTCLHKQSSLFRRTME